MGLKNEIDIIFVYLNHLKIKIDKDEFRYQVESHPDYPGLLAFNDALNFFSIPNVAFKASINEIETLPSVFLTILNESANSGLPYISIVKKVKEKYFYTNSNGKENEISIERLREEWTEIVLLVENDPGIKKRSNKLSLVCGIVITITNVILSYSIGNLHTAVLSTIVSIGVYLSIEAIKVELGFDSTASNKFCGATENSDCDQIINSDKSILGSVKLTDLSIWFFSTQLFGLYIFSSVSIDSILSLLFASIIALLPVTFYSIYFQAKIEKKWCPICLSIILIIYSELIYLFANNDIIFDIGDISLHNILLLLASALITALSYYFIKKGLTKFKQISDENNSNLRYIKKYDFFKKILLTNKKEPNVLHSGLSLGNPEAKISITVVYSPFCSFCKEAHESLYYIYSNYKQVVNIKVRFNFSANDELSQELYIQFHRIYDEEGELPFIMALDRWFKSKNINKWINLYSKPAINRTRIVNDIITDNYENVNNNIFYTPCVFINGYEYPVQISKNYILNFLPDLIEDNDFIEEHKSLIGI